MLSRLQLNIYFSLYMSTFQTNRQIVKVTIFIFYIFYNIYCKCSSASTLVCVAHLSFRNRLLNQYISVSYHPHNKFECTQNMLCKSFYQQLYLFVIFACYCKGCRTFVEFSKILSFQYVFLKISGRSINLFKCQLFQQTVILSCLLFKNSITLSRIVF